MDFELQRRLDGAVHKCFGEHRNTVTEIHKMDSTTRKKSEQSQVCGSATVANGNQASKVSKVHWQEAFDSESGTRISELCQQSESTAGDCVVLRMRKAYSMSLRSMRWSLSGTRSLRAGARSH